ncbi:MAG: hypothetical protein AAF296_03775 [Pseudomonadota bacterium]
MFQTGDWKISPSDRSQSRHFQLGACLFLVFLSPYGSAVGQGTGTVASPVIKPGSSVSLAAAVAFEDDAEGFAHRMDYRRSVSDHWRVGAILFFNDRGGEYRYRRFAAEAMYQFASSETGWNSAVQVRARVADGNDGPGRVRFAWLNRWRLENGPELRLIGLASQEIGDGRSDGIALETRGEATWQFGSDVRAGAQVFNRYNTTEAFGSFATQRHSIGGVVKGALSETLSYRVNVLGGVSKATPDFEVRARFRLKLTSH